MQSLQDVKLTPHGPIVLFDNIKEARSVFGRSERVVDLLSLLQILKNYSGAKRRSFDYNSSKIMSEIAFWNLSSSKIPTPKTDYPVMLPKEGERMSSKGACRNKKYSTTATGDVIAGRTIVTTESAASLLGAEEHSSIAKESKGRCVFGFFEKGILKLEPGNDPSLKQVYSPKVLNRYSDHCMTLTESSNSQLDVKKHAMVGIGVPQNFGFAESPNRTRIKENPNLHVSDLFNSPKFDNDSPKKDFHRKKNLSFDLNHGSHNLSLSPSRAKPILDGNHQGHQDYKLWSLKGSGVADALLSYKLE